MGGYWRWFARIQGELCQLSARHHCFCEYHESQLSSRLDQEMLGPKVGEGVVKRGIPAHHGVVRIFILIGSCSHLLEAVRLSEALFCDPSSSWSEMLRRL